MKKSVVIILSILVLSLFTGCHKEADVNLEREQMYQAELEKEKSEEYFNSKLNETNYFEIYPSEVNVKKGDNIVITVGIHNYNEENLNVILNVNCSLKKLLYYKGGLELVPGETSYIPIIIEETENENIGTYECELLVNEDSKNFSVTIE